MRRLLVINPNTSASVTEKIENLVKEETNNRILVETVTAVFGFSYISSRTATAIAAHAVLDAAARAIAEKTAPDAILLACFGDPGREALEEMTGLPVIGFAEAGLLAASELSGQSLVMTNGAIWCDMLWELILKLGISDRIAGVHSIENVANDPALIAQYVSSEAEKAGVDRVILGGAGLIPYLPEVIAQASVCVIDPHRIAIQKAVALANAHEPATSEQDHSLTDGNMNIKGLSPLLTAALKGA